MDILQDIASVRAQVLAAGIAAANRDSRVQLFVSSNEERNDDLKQHLAGIAIFTLLHAGDLWIVLDGKLLYVIERKAFQDLGASIGPRLHMQVFKLKQMPLDSWRVLFLIEGSQYTRYTKGRSEMEGAQANLMLRDQMGVVHTQSQLDTVYWVLKRLLKALEFSDQPHWTAILRRYPAVDTSFNPLEQQTVCVVVPSSSTSSSSSSQNTTITAIGMDTKVPLSTSPAAAAAPAPGQLTATERAYVDAYDVIKAPLRNQRTCYVLQLAHIKQLGKPKAAAIAERFPTMVHLAAFFSNPHVDKATKLREIANLTFATSTPPPINSRAQTSLPTAAPAATAATAPAKKRQKTITAAAGGQQRTSDQSSPAGPKQKKPRARSETRRVGPAAALKVYHMIVGDDDSYLTPAALSTTDGSSSASSASSAAATVRVKPATAKPKAKTARKRKPAATPALGTVNNVSAVTE